MKDQCISFINSTRAMELKDIWNTPYIANDSNIKVNLPQRVDDGLIEIVSYQN